MGYYEYLKSNKWKLRKERLEKILKGKECFICGSKKELHTHHKTYKRLYNEKDTDLVFVCKTHHNEIHKNKPKNILHETDKVKSKYPKVW